MSPSQSITITIHVDAPSKPKAGAPCNGCGVCCLVEPCPLGILLSRRRSGACVAVHWSDVERRYLCGAVKGPLGWIARRWIASGAGCDCDLHDPRGVDDNPVHD